MSGYFLMGERRLVCHVVPFEKIHPKLFQGSKRNVQLCESGATSSDRIEYWRAKEREVMNRERSMEGIKKITKRLLSREKKKRERLKALGIEYDFPGYTESVERVKRDENVTPTPTPTPTPKSTPTPATTSNGEEGKNNKKKKKKRKVSIDEPEMEDLNEATSELTSEPTTTTTTTSEPIAKKAKKSKKKKRKKKDDNDDEDGKSKKNAKQMKIEQVPKEDVEPMVEEDDGGGEVKPKEEKEKSPSATRKIGLDSRRKKSLMLMVKSNVRNAASDARKFSQKASTKKVEVDDEDRHVTDKEEKDTNDVPATPETKVIKKKAASEGKKKKKKLSGKKKRKSVG